ncbi:MAG: four helix bundle protein [Planctomycetota bacterium]|nr:MAG: four helix bundle protein [Planctomycetota bacterium]
MDLAQLVYQLTNTFPVDERFTLTSQLRRCATSIPSNIAEGQGRYSQPDFKRFLSIAHGSVRELETQILLAERLGYLEDQAVKQSLDLAAEAGRLIRGLANSIKTA